MIYLLKCVNVPAWLNEIAVGRIGQAITEMNKKIKLINVNYFCLNFDFNAIGSKRSCLIYMYIKCHVLSE